MEPSREGGRLRGMRTRTLGGVTPGLLAALVLPAMLVTGCGSHSRELDTHAIEVSMTQQAAKQYAAMVRVTCPSEVPIHAGDTFVCAAAIRDTEVVWTINVRVLDSAGHVQWALPAHG